jgi:deoxyribose-phosphate aldolase
MQLYDVMKCVDLAVLAPNATAADLKRGIDLVVKYDCASLCVASGNLDAVRSLPFLPHDRLCSVIGFPHGNIPWRAKEGEAQLAVVSGARELDVVLNQREWQDNRDECIDGLRRFRRAFKTEIIKLILETCYLNPQDIQQLSWYAGFLGWNFVKTSTGFGSRGASLEDVENMKQGLLTFPNTGIKASGGIKTKEELEAFITAGCSRIGVGVNGLISILKGYYVNE